MHKKAPSFYSHSVYTVVENLDSHRERESPEHLQTLKSSTPEMFFFMLWHWQTFS
jgi:hypothetical protein